MNVVLKKGREKSVKNGHPWIFSGAIESAPSSLQGDLQEVYSSQNEFLGWGYFNSQSKIFGRMISYKREEPIEEVKKRIQDSLSRRAFGKETNAFRAINGEGDFLPGLIVDVYDDLAVIQIGTLGMDKLKPIIIDALPYPLIYEKSELPSRKEEGMQPFSGWLKGRGEDQRVVLENNLKFIANLSGQKTGFFLDMREMRQLIKEKAQNKTVLNTFSYSGGFTLAALAGGAKSVTSVDISKPAIDLLNENVALNGFDTQKSIVEDVFKFLREDALNYDIVILDPPAFAKKAKDVVQACRGYKDLNRVAMSKMPPNSLLLTASCSHFVDEKLFQQVVFQASREAKRDVEILSRHRLAEDHPINLACPEGEYLKSFLLRIL